MTVKSAYPSLTAVLHSLVLSRPNGLDAETVAGIVGRNYQTMMSELSGQQGHKLGADLVLPLCAVTGSAEPLHFLARELGGLVVYRLPQKGVAGNLLDPKIIEAVNRFGRLLSSLAEARDNDSQGGASITAGEAAGVRRECYDLLSTLTSLLASLEPHSKGGAHEC